MSRANPVPDHVLVRRRQVGQNIRAARTARRLSQQFVAERAGGMDRATYVRIEQGQASPLLDTLILVADAIGVPLAHLVRD
ncbi:helix-turn-helix domain-containing protein [Streptomyces sp. NPDC048507]|uniref:helix-turn-helix domain-containing protein n=1 Tax=Streptomyces sp. NPDC048507 TaxID=3365560 RepID=UPI00371F3703